MKHQLRKMSGKGDELIKEWDETATTSNLKEIEDEFNRLQKAGYFAADITEGKDRLIQKFDPSADILMIPRVKAVKCFGGRS